MPLGHYKLYLWSNVENDGTTFWDIFRVDLKTGHAWVLDVPAKDTYVWDDIGTSSS